MFVFLYVFTIEFCEDELVKTSKPKLDIVPGVKKIHPGDYLLKRKLLGL